MRKRVGITIETTRVKSLSTLITGPKAKVEQDKYQSTVPAPTGGSTTATAPIEIDPLELPVTDVIGSGQTMYERLTLTAGEYCPTLYPNFYRRVWFNGLEAFQPYHFTVELTSGCVVPNTALPSDTIVTASYVKI